MAPSELFLVPATGAHALELATKMRPEDVNELFLSHGLEPLAAVMHAMNGSEVALAGIVDGLVACIVGVGPRELSGAACVWMLTTDVVDRHPRAFLKACRPAVRSFLHRYPILFNQVDARYKKAVRWAEWLGFKVNEAAPFGPERALFHRIEIRRSPWEG